MVDGPSVGITWRLKALSGALPVTQFVWLTSRNEAPEAFGPRPVLSACVVDVVPEEALASLAEPLN